MNTFLVSSKKIENARSEAKKISTERGVGKFDLEILEFEKALGIEDVRDIQKKIFLKPFKGDFKSTVVVMQNGATVDAQNSMLKLLEEPPLSSLIFLVTENALSFLPTILSRVKLLELKEEEGEIVGGGLKQILNLNGAGSRLALAGSISKEKGDAITWLEQTILAARQRMMENLGTEESLKIRWLIHELELTHYDLKTTNVNTRLSLENLFLNI